MPHLGDSTLSALIKCRREADFTWRPARTQSPETRSTLSARCRDDTVLRWLSYALDTAAGTGTFAWHTLHSTSPFISASTTATGSPKHCGSNQLRQNGRKIRGKSATIEGKSGANRDEPGEWWELGTLASDARAHHVSSRGPERSRFEAPRRRGGRGRDGEEGNAAMGSGGAERKKKSIILVEYATRMKEGGILCKTLVPIKVPIFYKFSKILHIHHCRIRQYFY